MCDCGHPRNICQHWDNDGWFTVETTQCHAKAAIERFSDKRTPEPGELIYTTYTRPASKPLPPFVVLNGQPGNGKTESAQDHQSRERSGASEAERHTNHEQ